MLSISARFCHNASNAQKRRLMSEMDTKIMHQAIKICKGCFQALKIDPLKHFFLYSSKVQCCQVWHLHGHISHELQFLRI